MIIKKNLKLVKEHLYMKYTKEEEIIHFVFLAFNNMKRKKENINLSFHSIMVGNMLKNIGCDEQTVFIGYLHDIIEDTKYDYDFINNKYGSDIAQGVLLLTENKEIKNYIDRKKSFINKIKKAPENILLIELADKLQNLISDYDTYTKLGKNFLITEANNYEQIKWYYKTLQKIFNERINKNSLLDRYNDIIDEYFK